MTATRVLPDGDAARAEAVELLRAGRIVAIPTDTVYGIAADLALPDAIERLFAAKRRPPEKAVAVLLADADQAWSLGVASPAAALLAERFWPGGLTLVLPVRPEVTLPGVLAAGTPTIGVRVPGPRGAAGAGGRPRPAAHDVGQPVRASPTPATPREVAATLGEAIALVIDGGPIRGGPASTVVDCTTDRPAILRSGAIDPRSLAAALDEAGIPHAHLGDAVASAAEPLPGQVLGGRPRELVPLAGRHVDRPDLAVLDAVVVVDREHGLAVGSDVAGRAAAVLVAGRSDRPVRSDAVGRHEREGERAIAGPAVGEDRTCRRA